jgi:hypothetical protein
VPLAEAHDQTGDVQEGLRLLVEMEEISERMDERWHEVEMHRVRAELLR